MGFENLQPSYVWEYKKNNANEISKLILDADFVIIGAAPLSLIYERIRRGLLTFRYSERLFKTRSRYLKWPIHFINSFKTRNCFVLCSGAYAAKDFINTGFYRNKCFKWGYFPKVTRYSSFDDLYNKKSSVHSSKISIVWVARLLKLKHPEYAIEIADRLRKIGVNFELHLIGNGILEEQLCNLVRNRGLESYVLLHGSMSPDEVRSYMEAGDIFMFTSNRQEGWGAVVNEAMNSGCAVVASHAAGAVPFLIQDNKNGLIFRSGDVNDLYEKVEKLVHTPEIRRRLGENAYSTMVNTWNAEKVVDNLLKRAKSIIHKTEVEMTGPCSPAPYLKENWF